MNQRELCLCLQYVWQVLLTLYINHNRMKDMLHDGLYEQVINKGLDSELSDTDKLSQTAPIDTAEASKLLAKYVAEVVERGLDNNCQDRRQV